MVRIRINTHPLYDYSNVVVLDSSASIREFVSCNRDDFIWCGNRPSTIMINEKDGKNRWENLNRIISLCLDNGYEIKARKERKDEWIVIKSLDDLQPLMP